MDDNLDLFISTVRAAWPAPISELVPTCRRGLAELTLAPQTETWLAGLHDEKPASRELYRDPDHGFLLLAHTETEGLYRPPHDHGRSWVVYAVQTGALQVRTYARLGEAGALRLELRTETILRPGQACAYLPGDIHDTRCLSDTAILLRFTERDLRHEDQVERRVTRFVEQDGAWTARTA